MDWGNKYELHLFFATFMRACFDFLEQKTGGGGGGRSSRALPYATAPACLQQWQHHVASEMEYPRCIHVAFLSFSIFF